MLQKEDRSLSHPLQSPLFQLLQMKSQILAELIGQAWVWFCMTSEKMEYNTSFKGLLLGQAQSTFFQALIGLRAARII